jgi:pentatricopeptide repeat protein
MFEEWSKKILSLSPKDFEELCFSLIQGMGFKNVTWREPGPDQGRDIEAIRTVTLPDGYTEITEKWFFESKRYKDSIPPDKIRPKIDWADNERADKLAIMSNNHFSNPCRAFIDTRQKQIHPVIIDWTGMRFLNILFSQPKVFKTYFPDEEIPQQFLESVDEENIVPILQDRFIGLGMKENVDLRQVTREFKITTQDPQFVQFVEENVLGKLEIPVDAKKIIYQMLINVLFKNREYEKALNYIDELIPISPDNAAVLINKGIILEENGDLTGAMRCYDEILRNNSKNASALNNMGHLFDRRGENSRALHLFEKAIEQVPNMEIAIANKAKMLSKMGRIEEAKRFINKELANNNKSAIIWYAKAHCLNKDMDFKGAFKSIIQSLKYNSIFHDAWNEKGVILEHNGRYQFPEKYNKMALDSFTKVTELAPSYELGWTNTLICLQHLSDFEGMERVAKYLEDNFPDKSDSLAKRGWVLILKGDNEGALTLLKEAIKADKNNYYAIMKECDIYLNLKKYKKVWRITRGMINSCNDSEYIYRFYLLMGKAWQGLGKKKKATKCFKKAEGLEPVPKTYIEDEPEPNKAQRAEGKRES